MNLGKSRNKLPGAENICTVPSIRAILRNLISKEAVKMLTQLSSGGLVKGRGRLKTASNVLSLLTLRVPPVLNFAVLRFFLKFFLPFLQFFCQYGQLNVLFIIKIFILDRQLKCSHQV